MSGGIGRSTASAGEQNVHGIDEQSIRSVASARGQQVRGVGKQVEVLGVGSKVGCLRRELARKWPVSGVSEQLQGSGRHQNHGVGGRADRSTASASYRQVAVSVSKQQVNGVSGRAESQRRQRVLAELQQSNRKVREGCQQA